MAIARAGTANGNNGPGQTTLTVSLVNGGGSNQVIVATGYITGSSSAPTVAYAGVSLTVIYSGDLAGGYNFLAFGTAPASGTNNLVLTAPGAGYNNIEGAIYSDVDQTTPYYGNGKFIATGTNPESISASGTSVDDWFYLSSQGNRDSTANANLTIYGNGATVDQFDSNGTIGSTSSRTYSINITSNFASSNYQYYLFLKKYVSSSSFIKSADGVILANIKSADGVANS